MIFYAITNWISEQVELTNQRDFQAYHYLNKTNTREWIKTGDHETLESNLCTS